MVNDVKLISSWNIIIDMFFVSICFLEILMQIVKRVSKLQ